MTSREFDVVVEEDEDGWLVGWVVGLPGCHTQARTMEELKVNIREAIEALLGDDEQVVTSRFVGMERVAVEA